MIGMEISDYYARTYILGYVKEHVCVWSSVETVTYISLNILIKYKCHMNFRETMLTKRNTITDLLRFFESQRINYADCDDM
jgi:hypothetical protein